MGKRIGDETLAGEQLIVEITFGDVWAAKINLAEFANATKLLLMIQDEQLHVLDTAPQRQSLLCGSLSSQIVHYIVADRSLRFSRAIEMYARNVWGKLFQSRDVALRQHGAH